MKQQVFINGKIETEEILNASGGNVIVARNGRLYKKYDPAGAKAYRQWKERSNKRGAKWPRSLPEGFEAKKNDKPDRNISRGNNVSGEKKSTDACCSCKTCILQVAQECIGGKTVCEAYKPSPRNVTYYH